MKFTNIKNSTLAFALVTLFLGNASIMTSLRATNSTVSAPDAATVEAKQLECGKKVGATLALCLFKADDNWSFLDYIQEWKKIIQEYCEFFDEKVVSSAAKALNDIEAYIKTQSVQGKWISPNKVALFLTQLTASLPKNVTTQLDAAFEGLQMRILKRNKPLGTLQLLTPLSNKLNPKPTV